MSQIVKHLRFRLLWTTNLLNPFFYIQNNYHEDMAIILPFLTVHCPAHTQFGPETALAQHSLWPGENFGLKHTSAS